MTLNTFLILLGLLAGYWIVKKRLSSLVRRVGRERFVTNNRIDYVSSVLELIWTIVMVVAAGMVLGLDYSDLSLFFTSAFAVLGVALFAQWSILSNVTASIIVFFFFPYRVGDRVRILDGENSVEGVIREITLFHVILAEGEREVVSYPNSMVFQKAVRITTPEPASARLNCDKEEATPPSVNTPDG